MLIRWSFCFGACQAPLQRPRIMHMEGGGATGADCSCVLIRVVLAAATTCCYAMQSAMQSACDPHACMQPLLPPYGYLGARLTAAPRLQWPNKSSGVGCMGAMPV